MSPKSNLFARYSELQLALCLLTNPQAHFNLHGDMMFDSIEARAVRQAIESEMQEMLDNQIWMEAIG